MPPKSNSTNHSKEVHSEIVSTIICIFCREVNQFRVWLMYVKFVCFPIVATNSLKVVLWLLILASLTVEGFDYDFEFHSSFYFFQSFAPHYFGKMVLMIIYMVIKEESQEEKLLLFGMLINQLKFYDQNVIMRF